MNSLSKMAKNVLLTFDHHTAWCPDGFPGLTGNSNAGRGNGGGTSNAALGGGGGRRHVTRHAPCRQRR